MDGQRWSPFPALNWDLVQVADHMKTSRFTTTRRNFIGTCTTAAAWVAADRLGVSAQDAAVQPRERVDSMVAPIRWDSFLHTPTDPDSVRARDMLRNATRHGLTSWWNVRMKFPQQTGEYLDFGRDLRKTIREHAGMASILATCLALRAYDPKHGGISEPEARARAIRLLRSVVYRHRSNSPGATEGIWGRDLNIGRNNRDKFDSCNIVPFAAVAGWLMWEHLDSVTRQQICTMLEDELRYYLGKNSLYYKDHGGNILYPGDTKAEEMGWQTTLFQIATAMMPRHPDYHVWMNKGIGSALAATSRPSDVTSTKIYHGHPLSKWLNGSNHHENGTAVNHKIDPHPHYTISSILSNYCGAAWYTLAGQPTPEAVRFNADKIYRAMVELRFSVADGYRPSGGTMYIPGNAELYFPSGNDKGSNEHIKYALGNANVRHFGGDELVATNRRGVYWEPLHAQIVLEKQARSADGGVNQTDEEGGPAREWWIGYHIARLYMAKWVAAQNRFRTTNEVFGTKPDGISRSP